MNTEITDIKQSNGWVCYDSDCPLCVGLAGKFSGLLARHRFMLVPLQTPGMQARLALDRVDLLSEMRLLKPDGESFGGADALLEISRQFWWAWPVRQLGRIPVVMNAFRSAYRWVANNRSCASGACKMAASESLSLKSPDVEEQINRCLPAPNSFHPIPSSRSSRHRAFLEMP